MEYLQTCFYKTTKWDEDNIFSNITATSQALLDFGVPNGCKLDISSKASDYLASSFTLSNYNSVNGSLAYLYSSIPLRNTMGTRDISLQDAISSFRIIEPKVSIPKRPYAANYEKSLLLYGRMYFPGAALEAMYIKRLSQQMQLLIKCISNPAIDKNSTMIVYLQKNTPKFLREFIYSTNEALFGFRFLYNFGEGVNLPKTSARIVSKFNNSVFSFGSEIWYAALSMSPALSTAFRYSTRSTSTGKPLTMTVACNPILGHISSDYTVKTSVSSTFCSRYDFNFFSYDSDLSLGFEIFNFAKNGPHLFNSLPTEDSFNRKDKETLEDRNLSSEKWRSRSPGRLNTSYSKHEMEKIAPQESSSHRMYLKELELQHHLSSPQESVKDHSAVTAFKNLVNESNFSSVFKCSASLGNKVVRLLWEGRWKEFLVSTGVKISLDPQTNTPCFDRFGLNLSFAC